MGNATSNTRNMLSILFQVKTKRQKVSTVGLVLKVISAWKNEDDSKEYLKPEQRVKTLLLGGGGYEDHP